MITSRLNGTGMQRTMRGAILLAGAIGAGEWMAGPLTTAKYGGAILWLSTLSILGQVVYNLEISRYTLYSGESIFTGKFRLLPGPFFWLALYLMLDFGSVFPYIASAAATPLAAVMVGEIAQPDRTYEVLGASLTGDTLLRTLRYILFIGMMTPLLFMGQEWAASTPFLYFTDHEPELVYVYPTDVRLPAARM